MSNDMRDGRVYRIYECATRVHRLIIAKNMIRNFQAGIET